MQICVTIGFFRERKKSKINACKKSEGEWKGSKKNIEKKKLTLLFCWFHFPYSWQIFWTIHDFHNYSVALGVGDERDVCVREPVQVDICGGF